MKSFQKKFANIQMLRAIAAMLVIYIHAFFVAMSYDINMQRPLTAWQRLPNCGVDIFFVLSGFIMVYVQFHKKYSPVNFFINRFVRIVPLYWFLILLLALIHVILPSVVLKTYFTWAWVFQSVAFTSDFFSHFHYPVLPNGWTLEYEMLFYLFFSASLFIRRFSVSMCVTIICVLVFVVITHHAIMIEFIFGMLIGFFTIHKQVNFHVSMVSFVIGVMLFAGTCFYPDYFFAGNGVPGRVWIWGVPAMFVIFGLVNFPQYKYSFMYTLGEASYSIYLFQFFAILPFYKMIHLFQPSSKWNYFIMMLCVIFSTAMGFIFYLLFEKPILKQSKKISLVIAGK